MTILARFDAYSPPDSQNSPKGLFWALLDQNEAYLAQKGHTGPSRALYVSPVCLYDQTCIPPLGTLPPSLHHASMDIGQSGATRAPWARVPRAKVSVLG